jgi:molecular chaperone DnaJ
MVRTHYETLEISRTASSTEIKQAYRRLAKLFHPDCQESTASHEKITQINAAYEILGDPKQRAHYDRQIGTRVASVEREQSVEKSQNQHRQRRTGQEKDEQLALWMRKVYQPVNRVLNGILRPLKGQLNELAADPFDDELLEAFQAYIDECREDLGKAQTVFQSMPNPANVAGVAAYLYHCLNHVSDGLDELERFGSCFDDHYLHTGQELFRRAGKLKQEAQGALKSSGL